MSDSHCRSSLNSDSIRVMKTPKNVEVAITSNCNLRCSYCSHFSSGGDVHTDLPTEEWQRFFTELGRAAVMSVTFSGGEPFFRKDIKELIQSIVDNRMRFDFLSNGTLITEEIADFISTTGRCDSVQVSIDGPGPESHDIFRGSGSFMKAVNGLKLLMKYSIPVTVRVTIHKHNVNLLDKVAELLIEELHLPGFSTNSASYMGLCRQNEDMVQLTVDEFSQAIATLNKLNEKYNNAISAQAGPLAAGKMWKEMQNAMDEDVKALPGGGTLGACGGVFSRFAVRADGMMVPCTQLDHIELGRINEISMLDIWRDHPELKRLRHRRNVPLSDFEFCRGCRFIPYCRGGCPALAYTLTGSDGVPSPEFCYRRFIENGGCLPG